MSGTFPFADMRISNQHHATRVLSRVCVCVCLGDGKWQCLLVFFVFFSNLLKMFFETHWDFPISFVAPKRILEQ